MVSGGWKLGERKKLLDDGGRELVWKR
jgi:hypothetical protein